MGQIVEERGRRGTGSTLGIEDPDSAAVASSDAPKRQVPYPSDGNETCEALRSPRGSPHTGRAGPKGQAASAAEDWEVQKIRHLPEVRAAILNTKQRERGALSSSKEASRHVRWGRN